MEKNTVFYNGRLYMEVSNGDLIRVPFGMDEARIKDNSVVKGQLDVIELNGQKYVIEKGNEKTLQKMTPELEEKVYSQGDLEDIIEMNNISSNEQNLEQKEHVVEISD